MEEKELNLDIITFGKYENTHIDVILKDRKYCEWLLKQHWFETGYPYLHKKVVEHKPLTFFLKNYELFESKKNIIYKNVEDFFANYFFFNLNSLEDVEKQTKLNENEKICYIFYLDSIEDLKKKIKVRQINEEENIFDIKAPSKWLQKFEEKNNLVVKRDDFKIFLSSYELPNITSIVEEIKKQGNLEYKGSKSFLIAKKRSSDQEKFWEDILKEKYNEFINVQFKFENCFFDFINIATNTIYECKLGLKDFNEEQYEKYLLITKNKYNIIYLIGNDCVIDMQKETIYTTNIKNYLLYQINIPLLANPTKFDELIFDYGIHEVDDLKFFL